MFAAQEGYLRSLKPTLNRRADILKITRLVLDRGADINALNYSENTALIIAAEIKSSKMTRLLLERAADINLNNSFNKSGYDIIRRNFSNNPELNTGTTLAIARTGPGAGLGAGAVAGAGSSGIEVTGADAKALTKEEARAIAAAS